MSGPNLSGFSMWALYRGEVETHAKALNDGLLALEERLDDLDQIKGLMRAAHSIKGAARVVRHGLAVDIAHAMEDRLVAAQQGKIPLTSQAIQRLLDGIDLIDRVSPEAEGERDARVEEARPEAERLIRDLSAPASPAPAAPAEPPAPSGSVSEVPGREEPATPADDRLAALPAVPPSAPLPQVVDRSIRLSAQTVTRMMGLAGEAVVSTRWLEPFSARLLALKRLVSSVSSGVECLAEAAGASAAPEDARQTALELQREIESSRAELTDLIAALEGFSLQQETLATRLYREVQATRMRPFSDLASAFPRLVRDVSKQLGKHVRLEIQGQSTDVDRDVAAALESPLIHAVRNAIDHGIEPPDERVARGKPETGTVRMSAWHRAGMLRIEVSDDGRGIDLDAVRRRIVERGLADASISDRLSEPEVLAFLFLPGFTTATTVSEVSGRGVGLDVVMEAVRAIGGRATFINRPGAGATLQFDLPVTLSVLRALVVEIADEPYAVPLNRIERVEDVLRGTIGSVEGRHYVTIASPAGGTTARSASPAAFEPRHVGLVDARQILDVTGPDPPGDHVPIVMLRDQDEWYGLAVDGLVGERSVVVRPLDARLGKVKDINAAGLLGDGTPLLVIDVDDMIRSIDQVLKGGRLAAVGGGPVAPAAPRKRVLVVDDSITVREVERQLLEAHEYAVDVAVDGIDGWNAVRTGRYDLVVTDIDMPRMDGIELVRRIRADRRTAGLPVMVVSYKDREEDRLRGLDAGASYYLPKASFHDDTFLQAVDDLIGHPGG